MIWELIALLCGLGALALLWFIGHVALPRIRAERSRIARLRVELDLAVRDERLQAKRSTVQPRRVVEVLVD